MTDGDNDIVNKSKHRLSVIHNPVAVWIILLLSLMATLVAYLVSSNLTEQRENDRFNFRAGEIANAVSDRISVYEQVLWSGVALFYASNDVDRQEWHQFFQTINIDKHWPGIQGMGFSIPISPEHKQQHINQIRAQGFPDYNITPPGKRKQYTAIIYLEPFDWRNQRAFGYDMWSNKLRRQAMARSRDQGVAAASGKITLVQETDQDTQPGFLLYLPVYQDKMTPTTLKARREKFIGWVYAPFRIKDFLTGIVGKDDHRVHYAIYDGVTTQPDALLHASQDNYATSLNSENFIPDHELWLPIDIQGRTWTFHFYNHINDTQTQRMPKIIVAMGIALDLLLFYVIISLHLWVKHSEKRVKLATLELRDTNQQQAVEINHLRDEVHAIESSFGKLQAESQEREQRVIDLKKEVNSLADQAGQPAKYKIGID